MKIFSIIPTKTVAELIGYLLVIGVGEHYLNKHLFNGAIEYFDKQEKIEEEKWKNEES